MPFLGISSLVVVSLAVSSICGAVLKPLELSVAGLPSFTDGTEERTVQDKVRIGESEASLLLRLLKYYIRTGPKSPQSPQTETAEDMTVPQDREQRWREMKRGSDDDGLSKPGPFTPALANRLLDRAWDHFIMDKGKLKRRGAGKLCYINPIACFGRRRESGAT